MGCLLNYTTQPSIRNFAYKKLSGESIEKRQGVGWTDFVYGDYIVGIHGNRLTNLNSLRSCHKVVLEFSSGRAVRYEGKHEPWRGESFSYKVPQPCLVYRITFGHCQKEHMHGLDTTLHIPISEANLPSLPSNYQQTVQETWKAVQKVDDDIEST
jgi:hypothetical protein